MKLAEILNGEPTNQNIMPSHQALKDLNQLSKTELENSLLKDILAEYQVSLLQSKKAQDSSLQNLEMKSQLLEQKINQLQDSNNILNSNLNEILKQVKSVFEKELTDMSGKTQNSVSSMESKLNSLLTSKLTSVGTETEKYVLSIGEMQKDAQKRFESFYGRKKTLDYIVIANLTIVPVLVLILTYVTFFKK